MISVTHREHRVTRSGRRSCHIELNRRKITSLATRNPATFIIALKSFVVWCTFALQTLWKSTLNSSFHIPGNSVLCDMWAANTLKICAELKQMPCVVALCWVYRQVLTAGPLMQSLRLTCVNANLLAKKIPVNSNWVRVSKAPVICPLWPLSFVTSVLCLLWESETGLFLWAESLQFFLSFWV